MPSFTQSMVVLASLLALWCFVDTATYRSIVEKLIIFYSMANGMEAHRRLDAVCRVLDQLQAKGLCSHTWKPR